MVLRFRFLDLSTKGENGRNQFVATIVYRSSNMPTPFQQEGRESGGNEEAAAGAGNTAAEQGALVGEDIRGSSLNVSAVSGLTRDMEPPSELDYKDLGRDFESVMNIRAVPDDDASPAPAAIGTTMPSTDPSKVPTVQALPLGYVADQGDKPPAVATYQGYSAVPPAPPVSPMANQPGAYRGGYPPRQPQPSPTAAWDPSPGAMAPAAAGPAPAQFTQYYPQSDERNDDDGPPPPWWRKHLKWVLLGIGAVVVVIVGAAIGAAIAGGGGDDPKKTTKPIPNKAELTWAVDSILRSSEDDAASVEALYGKIEDFDVSQVTDFSRLFDATERNENAKNFNKDISKWNLSKAASTSAMFRDATAFNQGK